MKDYYKYKITYKVGEVTAEFEEFCNPPAGEFTQEMLYEVCLVRALTYLGTNDITEYTFEKSNELEFRKWERDRLRNKVAKASLERSIKEAKQINHGDRL